MDQYRYFPGMQNLVDEFEEAGMAVKYYAGTSKEKFRRTRFYTGQKLLKEDYVYLAEFIVRAMNYKPQNNRTYDQILVNLLEDLVNEKNHSQEEVSERITLMGWNLTDPYVAVCFHWKNVWIHCIRPSACAMRLRAIFTAAKLLYIRGISGF